MNKTLVEFITSFIIGCLFGVFYQKGFIDMTTLVVLAIGNAFVTPIILLKLGITKPNSKENLPPGL